MKVNKWTIFLFFLFLFLYYGKDLLFSYFEQKDSFLQEKIILESDYNHLKKEYDKLLEEAQLWTALEPDFLTSKVVVRDPYLFFEEVTILKGSEDEVKIDDVVINAKGYVGRVKSVSSHHCQVELLTNVNTQMQVKVGNSYGILKKENGLLKVGQITSDSQIEEGEVVYTSGLSGMPSSIPIGVVKSVFLNGYSQELSIVPTVDFEDLSYVAIRKKEETNEL